MRYPYFLVLIPIFLAQVAGSIAQPKPRILLVKPRQGIIIPQVREPAGPASLEVTGNKRVSQSTIDGIIGTTKDHKKITALLLDSGLFQKVRVYKVDNKIKITVIENPVISKISFKATGTYLLDNRVFLDNLNIKVGDILNKNKLNRATEIVRQISIDMTSIHRIKVKMKQILEPNNQVQLRFEIFVYTPSRIRKANFMGNHKLTDSELYRNLNRIKVLQHPIPFVRFDEFNQLNLYEHKKSLEQYASSKGFLDFTVKNVSLVDDHFNIIVEEGDQYRVGSIRLINECPALESKSIKRYIQSLRSGDICDISIAEYIRSRISQLLIDRGLNQYRVRVEFTKKDKAKVDLEFRIDLDPSAFKVKRIVIKDNFKVREEVIRDKFKIQPGDYVNEDVLKYYQKRIETLSPVNALLHELQPDGAYDLEVLNSSKENPFELSEPSTSLITSMPTSSSRSTTTSLQINPNDVLELNINEVKKPTLLSILWESGKGDLCINLDHTNLGGRGITGMLYARSLEEILVGLSIPDHKTGALYSYRFIVGSEALKAHYFEPSDLIDFFVDSMAGYKYSQAGYLSDALKKSIKQDATLPIREFGRPGLNKLASDWTYSTQDFQPIIGKYCGFSIMCGLPIINGARLSLGLDIKNTLFQQIPDSPATKKYKVLTKELVNDQKTPLRADVRYREWKRFSTDEQLDLIISGYNKKQGKRLTEKEALELIKNTNKNELEKIYHLGEIERVYTGTGLSPVLKPALTEKIEFSPMIEYRKTWLLPRLNKSTVTVAAKVSPVFGTTTALKTQIMVDTQIPINHLLYLDLDYIIGWSLNSHYLDNFRSSDLSLCQSMGPIEMYSFIELGGKFMTRFKARIFYVLEVDPILIFYPNLSISWGGLSNCGIEPRQMPKAILEARKWPANSLDIAQNEFDSIVIVSPGARVRMGPLMLGFKFNAKIAGSSVLNLVRPVDIEFGFQL